MGHGLDRASHVRTGVTVRDGEDVDGVKLGRLFDQASRADYQRSLDPRAVDIGDLHDKNTVNEKLRKNKWQHKRLCACLPLARGGR
jgi:hypothetical protein